MLDYVALFFIFFLVIALAAADVESEGFLIVRILLDDEELAKELPLGGAGTSAIYTNVGKPFHMISKVCCGHESVDVLCADLRGVTTV